MTAYHDDQLLIKALKGNIAERDKALNWILKDSNWRLLVAKQVSNFGLEHALINDVFYDALSDLVVNLNNNKFRGDSALSTYFVSICKFKLKSILRQRKKRNLKETLLPNDQITIDDEEGIKAFHQQERQEAIENVCDLLLSKLGKNCRDVLTLRAMGYSMQEIADQKKWKMQSVKNEVHICRKKLREMVKDNDSLIDLIKSLL